ncbi:alpha/beta hydrolase [Cellulomonas cellasea]|uniref:alpha/beta fold hydrolase n=1 Tax=Cellulomonas cellasea TaxID=43670 RepID=UPI0025A47358|nr:alpha/beta hydrolase [Cellulomonas cellasea]MDM8086008.1 alpha/beta hydrolase [Cellulomonas cellasea]
MADGRSGPIVHALTGGRRHTGDEATSAKDDQIRAVVRTANVKGCGVRVDDLRLPFAVSTLGEALGEPAIVLPGGPCRGPEYLGEFAGLGSDHALAVLHPRGTPRSGGISRGWWTDAADVITLADALGLDTIDLVAHSAGTRLALAAAAQFPDRVRSMALVTPPATWLTGTPSDIESIAAEHAEREALDALIAMSTDEPSTESDFRESFRRQAPASYAHWTPTEQAHADVGAVSLAAASAWFTDIPDDAVERIRTMRSPRSLVIGGDQDLLTGVQPVRDYAALLSADLALIADCGHYPWIEQPAPFRHYLTTWLSTRP